MITIMLSQSGSLINSVAEQDGLTADGKWVFLVRLRRGKLDMMPVSLTELLVRVAPCGELGSYLANNVIRFNNQRHVGPTEYRCLGDSPAIGLILFEDCGQWKWQPAPEFDDQMRYVHNGKHRPIRVYENMDSRFILEDFYES